MSVTLVIFRWFITQSDQAGIPMFVFMIIDLKRINIFNKINGFFEYLMNMQLNICFFILVFFAEGINLRIVCLLFKDISNFYKMQRNIFRDGLIFYFLKRILRSFQLYNTYFTTNTQVTNSIACMTDQHRSLYFKNNLCFYQI